MTDLQDHPEYRQLVNAVRAAPDDDLPRLVLADWLEEHDAPDWAEFIRAHCEAERHPHAARIWADTFTDADAVNPNWQAALTCARLVRELWPKVAYTLCGDWDERLNPRMEANGRCVVVHPHRAFRQSFEVHRGFVERVGVTTARWLGEGHHDPIGPEIVARQPVREVLLRDREFPHHTNGAGWWMAMEEDDNAPENRHMLPWCIARRLRGSERHDRIEVVQGALHQWLFHDRAPATDALSAAAIEWALEEAGR